MTQKSSHMVIIVWLDAVVTLGFMLVNGSFMLSADDGLFISMQLKILVCFYIYMVSV